jgi:hypothetical protein
VRKELEGRGEIPHVETREDTKGRKQKAKKLSYERVQKKGEIYRSWERREGERADPWLRRLYAVPDSQKRGQRDAYDALLRKAELAEYEERKPAAKIEPEPDAVVEAAANPYAFADSPEEIRMNFWREKADDLIEDVLTVGDEKGRKLLLDLAGAIYRG